MKIKPYEKTIIKNDITEEDNKTIDINEDNIKIENHEKTGGNEDKPIKPSDEEIKIIDITINNNELSNKKKNKSPSVKEENILSDDYEEEIGMSSNDEKTNNTSSSDDESEYIDNTLSKK
jgi:hypothetical protein